MKIKDFYRNDRPREKLIKFGPERLTTSELFALILVSGTREKNVVDLSKEIIKKYSLSKFVDVSIDDLLKFKGIGKANAIKIIALLEISKRIESNINEFIYSPKDIFINLKNIAFKNKEYFFVFCLYSRNKVIKKELVSIGTLNSSLVHPREVFEPAIRNLSAQLVISHNHPSGDIYPSGEDIEITNKLVKVGILLGISVIDHVIVSNSKYFSFKEKGLL